jgi:hypothetical protein
MKLQLTSSPLAVSHVEYDDRNQKLVIGQHIAPLTPREYSLAITLLHQRQKWQESGLKVPLCLSVPTLMKITGISPRELLIRHLSNASTKLAPFGIYIICARSYGYFVLFSAEVE